MYLYTAISRKVVGKNVHATTPKGNMGYDQYTVSNDCSCRTYFGCFSLALANICPWPLVSFFQISLENRADKTTHNTFRDCRVQFFRQPFSKQLYISWMVACVAWRFEWARKLIKVGEGEETARKLIRRLHDWHCRRHNRLRVETF